MKTILDKKGSYNYQVYSQNGKEIISKKDNLTIDTKIINQDGFAEFELKEIGDITFIPICKDNNGQMCQISYEKPSTTGFHLIKYPNRDGISTTGSGFLVEAIPVVSGKSFDYYKTYNEKIEKIREYDNSPFNAEIKVDDLNDNSRRICIHREKNINEIIPFSRKYFYEHMKELFDEIGINNENIDYNKIRNDENGCIVFDSSLIIRDKIKYLSTNVCDLPVSSIINPDVGPETETKKPFTQTPITESQSLTQTPITESQSLTQTPITKSQSLTQTPITKSQSITQTYTKTSETQVPITNTPTSISSIITFPFTQTTDGTTESVNPDSSDTKTKKSMIIIIISVTIVVLVTIIVIVIFIFVKRKRKNENFYQSSNSLYSDLIEK